MQTQRNGGFAGKQMNKSRNRGRLSMEINKLKVFLIKNPHTKAKGYTAADTTYQPKISGDWQMSRVDGP